MKRWRSIRSSSPRGEFFTAGAVGGSLALVVFTWFAWGGRADPLRTESLANFYEVQARAWLHGRWDAGAGDFLFERFNVNGRFFTYFGPAPALLRLPFVAFTDSFDGRLSRISMMLAFGVLLIGATALCWQARTLLRGAGRTTRSGLVATGVFVFLSGCGTTALFLAAKTWVYHEAILWGAALSIASFSFLIAYLRDPRTKLLVGASVTAALAFLSRGSVGTGPVFALAVVFAAQLASWIWARLRNGDRLGVLRPLGLGATGHLTSWWRAGLALAVPVVAYASVNFVKFHTFFGTPPYDLQDELAARVTRQAALAANHNSLFGLKFAPTILWAYVRPDGIRFDRLFPWVSFAGPPRILGNVVFEATNFSASITVTSLVFTVLVALGIWAVIRNPRPAGAPPDDPSVALFRVPIVGAIVGCAGMLVLAFLEERYIGDCIPLMVVGGAVGLWWVAHRLTGMKVLARRLVITGLAVITVWSVWSTASLTLLEQRAFGPLVSNQTRAEFIDLQLDVFEKVPGGTPSGVERGGRALPAPARAGTFYVVGECDGLYWSNGRFWHPVEETPLTGRFLMHVVPMGGMTEPLLSATDARGTSIIWIEHLGGGDVRFVYQWTGENQGLIEGVSPDAELIGQRTSPVVHVSDAGLDLNVQLDPAGYVGVRSGSEVILSTFAPVATEPARVGVQDVSASGSREFSGTITVERPSTPICDRLLGIDRH